MTPKRAATTLALFGVATLASGLYRYLSADGGEKGLWFGVVMGAIGLAGAASLARGRRAPGRALGWTAVVFVGGWFTYEALVKKGLAEAEPRQLALIAFAAFVAAVLARSGQRAGRQTG